MEGDRSFYALNGAVLAVDKDIRIYWLRKLIKGGADVTGSDGGTALISAAIDGYLDCVRLLLEAGADVNYSDDDEATVLMSAAWCEQVECVRLLLEAGSDVNKVDKDGDTTLTYCLTSLDCNNDTKACLKLLINAGVDINSRNNNHLQPIHFALKKWQRFKFQAEYMISENCNLSQASYDQVKACVDKEHVDYYSEDYLNEDDRLDMLKMLFACGLPRQRCQSFIVEKETTIKDWVETVASHPNTLQSSCVFEIRRILGLGIKSKITKLNLPTVIQNLILLKGILNSECFI